MSWETKETDQAIIAYPGGRMDFHRAPEIEIVLEKLIKDNPDKNIILNMKGVEYMSSSGLRVFVSAMQALQRSNRSLKLTCLRPAVRKVFEVVEIIDLFEIYPTEEAALSNKI